jgi:hypothetical protein
MSHGFPRRSKRNRRKEKRPQSQIKSTPTPTLADKPISQITAGLIADLSRPLHSAALAEAIKEQI